MKSNLINSLVIALIGLLQLSFVTVNAADVTEQDLKALPELRDDSLSSDLTILATPRMKCFVDTPAYDLFTYNRCFGVGSARTTTAVFKIDGGPSSNYSIIWSNSRCSRTSKTCFLPISQGRTIRLNATILDFNTSRFYQVSATARYDGLF